MKYLNGALCVRSEFDVLLLIFPLIIRSFSYNFDTIIMADFKLTTCMEALVGSRCLQLEMPRHGVWLRLGLTQALGLA